MKRFYSVLFLCLLGLALACSDDEDKREVTPPIGGDTSGTRREILLTLNNKLKVKTKAADTKAATPAGAAADTKAVAGTKAADAKAAGTKATDTKSADTKAKDLIATDAENEIATLDIYIFGAEKESDVFTFQELLYYRYDGSTIDQPWAKSFELLQKNENETNGLLEVQKGLFVKMYVVANHPGLVGSIDGTEAVGELPYSKFKALTMNGSGIEKRTISTLGAPTEDRFVTFRTPLLKPDDADDVLMTPLPMVGSYLTALDLTDFEVNTRLQAGFKLNRIVSRFDIVNDAAASRFTLKSVSMGKGRSGVHYFPIKPYEAAPPLDDAQIQYWPRPFTGAQTADDKLQTGAFYCYPSPKDDKAYLILNGSYAVNQTEQKEVTYQVPFKQEVADGTGNYIEIAYNHRYTLFISDADEYHLDVDIRVADWDEGGSIDDYQPDTAPDSLNVVIEAVNGVYDPAINTVSLYLDPANFFYINTASNAGVTMTYSYDNGNMDYDWLKITTEEIETKAGDPSATKAATLPGTTAYRYKVAPNPDYKGKIFPRARLVFKDNATTQEQYIYVRPFGKPEIHALAKSPGDTNPNFFVDSTLVLTMYRALGSTLPLQVTCPDGSKVVDLPTGMEAKKNESLSNSTEWIYNITINDTTGLKDNDTIPFSFANAVETKFATEVKLAIRNAGIDPTWQEGDENTWNADKTVLTMPLKAGNKFQLSTRSISGVKVAMDFGKGPAWLQHNGEAFLRAGNVPNSLVFTLNNNHLVGAGPVDITITNNYQGDPYKFRVTPVAQEPILPNTLTSSVPSGSGNAWTLSTKKIELYKYSSAASDAVITVLTPGGSEVVNPYAWLTVLKDSVDYQTNKFTFRLAKDAVSPVDKGTYKVTLRNLTDTTNKKVEITVVPKYDVPSMVQKSVSHASLNSYTENASGGTLTLYKSPTGTSWVNVTATSKGGSKFDNLPAWLTPSPASISAATSGDYSLTLDNAKVGSTTTAKIRVCNLSDPSGTYKDITVNVKSSDITAPYTNVANTSSDNNAKPTKVNMNFPSTTSGSASFKLRVTSIAGFVPSVEYATGSSKWLNLSTTASQKAGSVDITVSLNTANMATAKVATVRLKNSFAGGSDYTVTVTPVFPVPTVVASGTPVPAGNTLSGTVITLYKMNNANATFQLQVDAGGGSALQFTKSLGGLTVSPASTTTAKGIYTLTAATGATVGSATLRIKNGTDGNKYKDYTVNVVAATITANNVNPTAQNNLTTNIPVTSQTGVTASVTNWNGGGQWFDITTNNVNNGTNQNIVIKQKANLSNTIMKATTIRLTSKVGNIVKDITVTPTLSAPTLSASSATDNDYYLNSTKTFSFTTTTVGGWVDATTSNASVATVSRTNNTYTITPVGPGTATITVPNGSDASKKSTYTITFGGKNYNGKFAWKYQGFYIAPEDAGTSSWSSSLSNRCPSGWSVPSRDDFRSILGGTDSTSGDVFNEYKNKGVFTPGNRYWSSTSLSPLRAYGLYFASSSASVGNFSSSGSYQLRCVSK